MSHDIQWIHKGSSCILPRSSMSKVSCLKIHNDRKEISSSFVTEEKIIFNQRPKKKNPIRQIRLNDRLNINADMKINIPDLEVAYLSSHEGFTKLRHFWFQYHVCHLSVWTVRHLFMTSLTASKLSRQFWSSKRQRARASDFSTNLKTTGVSNSLFIKFL